MNIFVRWHILVVMAESVILTGISGCGARFPVPAINKHPTEKLALEVNFAGSDDRNNYHVRGASVYYTTEGKGCGHMDYTAAIGGIYVKPSSEVNFASTDNIIVVYKDYFETRQQCPLKINQVVININDSTGWAAALNANDLVASGGQQKEITLRCERSRALHNYVCRQENEFGFNAQPLDASFVVSVRRLATKRQSHLRLGRE